MGLIPAGAGNIFDCIATTWFTRAHPRGCGEHVNELYITAEPKGSSPRVRGTFSCLAGSYTVFGLIPAGAGNIR